MCAQFESHFKNLLACVHSMGEIELDSGRAKSTFLELEKGLSKLESGTCHDAANFSGKVEASFTHHVALLLENAKRKALKSDAPLLEYMTVAVDHKRKHFAKARAKRSRRNMTDSLQNNDNRIDRFVGVITMGSGDIAARGIEKQLGISDEHVSYIKSNPMELISWEFGLGTDDWADVMLGFDIDPARTENHRIRDEDTENFRCVKDGTHPDRSVTPLKPGDQEWDVQTMEMLMQHHFIELAELEYHHVFALRLYTTSSYTQINNPLREQIKPHPFAATVFCIKEAVLKLRALHGMMPYKNDKRVYWRGMKDLTVTPEFQREGGTELACVSTSSSKAQAIKFSESEHPLLFKFTSSNFMSRGAEISFLSVYPSEEEVLYPPGTYLAPDEMVDEQIGGKEVQILSVSPSC
jgi:phosphopantetheinyl transferase (holo-ACP synthase)